jgi:hypothetical protein
LKMRSLLERAQNSNKKQYSVNIAGACASGWIWSRKLAGCPWMIPGITVVFGLMYSSRVPCSLDYPIYPINGHLCPKNCNKKHFRIWVPINYWENLYSCCFLLQIFFGCFLLQFWVVP